MIETSREKSTSSTAMTRERIICLKVWIPLGVVIMVVVEVIFGLLIVAKLPLGVELSGRMTRWMKAPEPTSPKPVSACDKIIFRPFQSLTSVALVSYPQSGNAWTRHLIEKATGIYTGTTYSSEKNNAKTSKHFPGNKVDYRSGRLICVKTHRYEPRHIREFEAAILLLRHPFQSILSEAYRQHILKPTMTEIERDTALKSHRFRVFVQGESLRWRNIALRWLELARSTYVIHYSDLMSNPNQTLEQLVRYLNIPVRQDRLECTLAQYPPLLTGEERTERLHRQREYLTEIPYTQMLESTIMEYVVDVNISLMMNRQKPFPWNFTLDWY
nr:WSC domain-containing protein 1-like [Lytechinus pictus]